MQVDGKEKQAIEETKEIMKQLEKIKMRERKMGLTRGKNKTQNHF